MAENLEKHFRLSLVIFTSAVSLLLVVSVGAQFYFAPLGAFALHQDVERERIHIARLPSVFVTLAKMKAVNSREKLSLGIFGSSRSLMLSHKDMGVSIDEFFNFSIGGQSFRNSTVFLKWLADRNRAPYFSVIAIDNFQLEFFGNPSFANIEIRLVSMFDDVLHLYESNAPIGKVTRSIWRHMWTFWQDVRAVFSSRSAWNNFLYLIGSTDEIVPEQPLSFRKDGSFPYLASPKESDVSWTAPSANQIEIALIKLDLNTLGNIRSQTGSHILVYETPLHPSVSSDSQRYQRIRREFLQECTNVGIVCVTAQSFVSDNNTGRWSDASHPPSRAVSSRLKKILLEMTR